MVNRMKKLILIAALPLTLSACGFEVVDTGHRGVKTTFGEVVSESLPEGFYTYNPLTSTIVELDTRTQRWQDSTETYTKDVQQAKVGFVLNYGLDSSAAHIIYKEVGYDWADKLVPQVVYGSLKEVIGKWDAVDLISNRNKAQAEAMGAILSNLKIKHISVTSFEITDIAYSREFEVAVEAKVVAQQKAIEEKNRTEQIREQADQKLLSAKAEAESIKIRAQALESNPRLVEWEAVQKWDGKMPQYMLGGATPFISLPAGK